MKWPVCEKPHLRLSQCTRSSGTLCIRESETKLLTHQRCITWWNASTLAKQEHDIISIFTIYVMGHAFVLWFFFSDQFLSRFTYKERVCNTQHIRNINLWSTIKIAKISLKIHLFIITSKWTFQIYFWCLPPVAETTKCPLVKYSLLLY